MRLRHSAVSGVGCSMCSSQDRDSGKVGSWGTGEGAVVFETVAHELSTPLGVFDCGPERNHASLMNSDESELKQSRAARRQESQIM